MSVLNLLLNHLIPFSLSSLPFAVSFEAEATLPGCDVIQQELLCGPAIPCLTRPPGGSQLFCVYGLFYVNPRCLKLSQISDGVCKLLKNIVLRVKHFLSSFKSFHLKFLIAVWLQEAPVYDCAVTTSLS